MLFGARKSSFQNHKDIVCITALDGINDNDTVFTSRQHGLYVRVNVNSIL